LGDQKLHPTVKEFKEFVNRHPKLLKHLRKKGRPWQEYYEKWILLGEEDDYWNAFKGEDAESGKKNTSDEEDTKKKNTELFSQLIKMAENMDMDKVQKQVHQLSDTLSTVQEAISQFQKSKGSAPNQNPYQWPRD